MHTDFLFIILLCIVAEIGFDIILMPVVKIVRHTDVRRGKPAAGRVVFSLGLGAGGNGIGLGAVPSLTDGVPLSIDFGPFKGPFPGGSAFPCA